MDKEAKECLKKKILKRYELYKLGSGRIKRFIKDPFGIPIYFFLALVAYIHPYKVTKKTLWGDPLTYYLPEGSAIFYYGFFEANLTNFFIDFLRDGDIFFDIGAHVGFYSKLASKLVGSDGQVHSFEPTPRTFKTLSENFQNQQNIYLNNNALLDKEGKISFIDYGPKYSAFNSFQNRSSSDLGFLQDEATKIEVKAITLDNYCQERKVSPRFIKIDAEGAEYLILNGAKNILQNIRPVISIEVSGGEEWAENCQKSISLLKGENYIPYQIAVDGKLSLHKCLDQYGYDNLIFLPKEKVNGYLNFIAN